MLHTTVLSFMDLKCSALTISRLPVVVTTMSASFTAFANFLTSYPSMAACNAQIGSISVTITRTPALLSDSAEPFPTSPSPATTATLPASIRSVARRIASTSDSRQPYLLSNLDLVTESFTLIAGRCNVPFFIRSYNRCTPVVVSSESPLIPSTSSGYLSKTMLVRSPPSSKIILSGCRDSPKNNVCSMHQLNSSSVIPFHAYTGMPLAAMAAAAWSCEENMLHDDQVTSAPISIRVSINTADSMVIFRTQPIRTPIHSLALTYSSRR